MALTHPHQQLKQAGRGQGEACEIRGGNAPLHGNRQHCRQLGRRWADQCGTDDLSLGIDYQLGKTAPLP